MLFQVLDHKNTCVGYFSDNHIYKNMAIPLSGGTWEYTEHLQRGKYELGSLYAAGASMSDACPPRFTQEWENVKKALKSYLKALNLSQVSLESNCFYEMVPEFFLYRFLDIKTKITEHVLATYDRPANYECMYNLLELLNDIRSRDLNIDTRTINHLLGSVRGQNFRRTLQNTKHVCDYNPWGTVTGRLATSPNSFPILTMNKEFRGCVKPRNDWLLELDFNAAELRTLIALTGNEQPHIDIHEWNRKNIYRNIGSREDAKKRIFAWMYNSKSEDFLSNRAYDKETVKNKYWDGSRIETDYGRVIENVDEHHALNYIVQSTTIDMVHEQAYKIHQLLKGKKSYISFLIHDAVYIDLADEDRYEILNLLDTFRNTRYDMFMVNTSAGKSLGELGRLRL